jgi:taurine dioxygenase
MPSKPVIRPLCGALGAEIEGIDLSGPLDDEDIAFIRQAFTDHLVIFFRNQSLTPEQHKAFSRRFAPFSEVPYIKPMAEHPEIIEVIREADESPKRSNFGGKWHSDLSFLEAPPLGSLLYAREVPRVGGDTMWCNMYQAYEALSDGLREFLDNIRVMHSARRSYGPSGTFADDDLKSMRIESGASALSEYPHPAVRVIPESGKRALFVNPVYAIRFEGWTEAESTPLLNYLHAHCVQPQFVCRFRWTAGTLAFWDNRCTQHFAVNDYQGQRRHMQRVTLRGERPVSIADAVRQPTREVA